MEKISNISDKNKLVGLTSFELKFLALVFMIIDHFGYYFYQEISTHMYIACRIIGRLSMPIFLFILVQGFIHTSNIKKYLGRISIFAIITQLVLFIVEFIGINVFKCIYEYNACLTFNILFSFAFCLIFLYLFRNIIRKVKGLVDVITKNEIIGNKVKDCLMLIVKILAFFFIELAIFFTMYFVKFDYGIKTLIIALFIYFLEVCIKNEYIKRKGIINFICLVIIFTILIDVNNLIITFSSIFPTFFLIFYNEKLSNKQIKRDGMKYLFYVIFPVQHFLLYFIAILLQK